MFDVVLTIFFFYLDLEYKGSARQASPLVVCLMLIIQFLNGVIFCLCLTLTI